ncbi:MAG: AAA family ATPase [Bacteroidota bacterium]
MYIRRAEIENIRSIEQLELTFDNPTGWHVIIGDNGAGKSTLIRSLALTLIGPKEAMGLRQNWADWLNSKSDHGYIKLHIEATPADKHVGRRRKLENSWIPNILDFRKEGNHVSLSAPKKTKPDPEIYNWGHGNGWFSCAFGPYRRFEGGNQEWSKVFYSQPKLGAHLSVFGEDVALTESIDWLVKLHHQKLESNGENRVLEDIKALINSSGFLPHNTTLHKVTSEGVQFKDGNNNTVSVHQLSDGYRSVLSMTFELIRQLVVKYGPEQVFSNIRNGEFYIDFGGVVLIDEVDTHLHPTWQTRIGDWFTRYFPKMQFIVSTHSPLICRASTSGTVWQLRNPGSDLPSGQITGKDKNRLIMGNILDAYSTNVFGSNVTISKSSSDKLKRLGELNVKTILGESIGEKEKSELAQLKEMFPTEPIKHD